MRKLALAAAALAIAALLAVRATRAEDKAPRDWKKLRADWPAGLQEPTGKVYEYKTPLPEGWTPPKTLDEVIATFEKDGGWTDGRLYDAMKGGLERSKALRAAAEKAGTWVKAEDALKLKNDTRANNDKLVAALCQYPASDDEVDWDATFNRHAASPNTLNPILSSSAYETYMNGLHAFGLFGFDHEMQPFADPENVKSWKRNPLCDVLELQPDLTWDDGEPITAYDIEFSYHAIMDPNVPVPAQRNGTSELKWVKAYSPTTIVYFHKEKMATNVWNVNFTVIPKHIYERSLVADSSIKASAWHAYWNRNPLAGGSYRLKEWQTGQHVTFERREELFGPKSRLRKPYFKQVRFRLIDDANASLLALKKGDLDEMILTARQWEKQTGDDDFYTTSTKVRGPEWTYGCVVWNLKRPWFSDVRVRKAMAYAFDHDELLKKVYFDLYDPCTGPFNPASPWGTPGLKPYKQNLEEAEKLLDEAGWKDSDQDGLRDKGGQKFEFTMLVPTGGTGPQVGELLKQNLKDLGIALNLKMLEFGAYGQKMLDHDFDCGVQAWGSGADPDTAKNIWNKEAFKAGRNYGGYENDRVDQLFKEGAKELDLAKRRLIYQEINKLIYEDQPYLFLNYRATFWGFSKDIRGYNFSPRGLFSYSPGSAAMWKKKKTAQ